MKTVAEIKAKKIEHKRECLIEMLLERGEWKQEQSDGVYFHDIKDRYELLKDCDDFIWKTWETEEVREQGYGWFKTKTVTYKIPHISVGLREIV